MAIGTYKKNLSKICSVVFELQSVKILWHFALPRPWGLPFQGQIFFDGRYWSQKVLQSIWVDSDHFWRSYEFLKFSQKSTMMRDRDFWDFPGFFWTWSHYPIHTKSNPTPAIVNIHSGKKFGSDYSKNATCRGWTDKQTNKQNHKSTNETSNILGILPSKDTNERDNILGEMKFRQVTNTQTHKHTNTQRY